MGTLFRPEMRLAMVMYLLARAMLPLKASFSDIRTRIAILLRAMPRTWLFDTFFLLKALSFRCDNAILLNRFVRTSHFARSPGLFQQGALGQEAEAGVEGVDLLVPDDGQEHFASGSQSVHPLQG